MLKKVKTEITYRVPAYEYCNLIKKGSLAQPTADMCRFCVKDSRKGYRCALYNMPLETINMAIVKKTRDCERAVLGYKSVVEDVIEEPEEAKVDPSLIVKTTVAEYEKLRKSLISQGYPETVAVKVATQYVTGGK